MNVELTLDEINFLEVCLLNTEEVIREGSFNVYHRDHVGNFTDVVWDDVECHDLRFKLYDAEKFININKE